MVCQCSKPQHTNLNKHFHLPTQFKVHYVREGIEHTHTHELEMSNTQQVSG